MVTKCHRYTMRSSISIKQLHQTTGEHVRRAARSNAPIAITDRGRPVAVLAKPALLRSRRPGRTLLPEYRASAISQDLGQRARGSGCDSRRSMIACDTSAVAKFYVPEKESRALRQLLETEDGVCVSELVRPELMAVFHRRLREGDWNRRDFTAAVRQFQHDDLAGFWTWLPIDSLIMRAAAEAFATLPPTVFLRSSDCIHIVTALHNNFTEFVTFDIHQMRAASSMGLRPRSEQRG